MEDWSVTNTRPADYIRHNGKKGKENHYVFMMAGSKMFIYHEGKVLGIFDL